MPPIFTDKWLGNTGDPWDSTKWITSHEGSVDSAVDIQSNQGRMFAGTAQDDFGSATADSSTNLNDGEVLLYVDASNTTGATNNKWLYVCLRSTGEQVAGNAGRPATAYYMRLDLSPSATNTDDDLYRRNSDSEGLVGPISGFTDDSLYATRNGGEPFWFKFKLVDDSPNVVAYVRMWNASGFEPTGWAYKTDSSPGALLGASGVLQLIVRDRDVGNSADVRIDHLRYDVARDVTSIDRYSWWLPPRWDFAIPSQILAGGGLVVETAIRPVSDTAVAGWDTAPTGSQELWAQVDEVVASDTDYIYATDPNP